MDDIVRDGVLLLIGSCIIIGIAVFCIVLLALRELQAVAEGDAGFVLASLVALVLLALAYLATGRWLQRTGRI
jgi:uncharacterized membrane protein